MIPALQSSLHPAPVWVPTRLLFVYVVDCLFLLSCTHSIHSHSPWSPPPHLPRILTRPTDRQITSANSTPAFLISLHQLPMTQLAAPHQLLYPYIPPTRRTINIMWFWFQVSLQVGCGHYYNFVGHNRESTNDCKDSTLPSLLVQQARLWSLQIMGILWDNVVCAWFSSRLHWLISPNYCVLRFGVRQC